MTLSAPRRPRRYRVPRGGLGERPWALSSRDLSSTQSLSRVVISLAAALAFHSALLLLGRNGKGPKEMPPRPPVVQSVSLEKAPAPAEPPPPPVEPRPRHRTRGTPAAAEAGKVVTRPPDPDQPVDMTDFTMPEGKGEAYAGGFTAPSGTSTSAVEDPAASASGRAPAGSSMARSAAPARQDWACAWPEQEEQNGQIRDVRVVVRVHVNADGAPIQVDLPEATAPSFALAARRCALGEAYRAARDDDGHPVPGVTPSFVVHFLR